MTSWRALVGIGVGVGLWLTSYVAKAESYGHACVVHRVHPASGELPRDQPAFVIVGHGRVEVLEIVLAETDTEGVETEIPVTVERTSGYDERFVVTPAAPLTPGTSLELRGNLCRDGEGPGEFSVIYRVVDAPSDLPAPPLTLSARVRGQVRDRYYDGFSVDVLMDVEGGGELRAWSPIVGVELGIDDQAGAAVVDGPRRARRGYSLACEGFAGLEPGTHTLRGSIALVTGAPLGSTEREVVIACEDAVFYDGRRELTPEEASWLRHRPPPRDAGPPDAGPHDADAGDRWDAGPTDAGTEESGKGGCSAAGAGMTGAWWVLAVVAWGRRRR